MIPLRGVHLGRRTLLRGVGAGLALPWLDAMVPVRQAPPPAPVRCLFVFSPNGMHMEHWRPKGDGPTAVLGRTLEPLQPFQKRLSVWSGLAIDGGRAHGDGPGDHARAGGSFLTCAHPKKTGGADLQAGVSIDQHIARQVGGATTFPSLELGMEKGASAGICDSGYSCAYSGNVSWRTPSEPVAKETEPKAVFARLFGDPEAASTVAEERAARQRQRSVLDAALADAKALAGKLGPADRQKLDQYLQSIRELEQRLQRLDEGGGPAVAMPKDLLAGGQGYPERLDLMYELLAMAFATDRVRVATFMLGNAGSNRSYKFLDVPDGHHDLSHHGKKAEKLQAIAAINRFQVERFGAFLARLQGTAEGGSDLLEQSLVLFGSGLGDGDRHNHDDLPILLAGGGGGAAKGLGHVRLGKETPLANLHLAIWRAVGGGEERFADSNGVLALR